MKYIYLLSIFVFLPEYSFSQVFNKVKVEKIQAGIKLDHWSGTHEKWGTQYILILKAKYPKYRLDLAFAKDSLIKTSSFAKQSNALAAINGGFFDMKAGGSVSFLVSDGKVIHENKPNVLSIDNEMGANALVIYENGKSEILPTEGANRIPMLKNVEDALVTGPLLLNNSQINNLQKRPFNDLKHPRSAICIGKKEIWLIAVDGRHKEATGLNLNELSQFLLTCGCQHAINLDGGGSTTLFLNTNKFNGIVNHPSDNKKFDSEGERSVANILFIRKNN
ncbi:MAG: phosphodiester glycosidase family protein [Saprospiraceae bacterium]|nr:phosphodiester glycosidase family protein [Saprospiraceae bacterium]